MTLYSPIATVYCCLNLDKTYKAKYKIEKLTLILFLRQL